MVVKIQNGKIQFDKSADGLEGFTLTIRDFSVLAGETVFVVGLNGTGKTTLLRAIAGRIQLTGNGSQLPSTTPFSWMDVRGVDWLVPHMMVSDHLLVALAANSKTVPLFPATASYRFIRDQITKLGDIIDLSDHLGKRVSELSAGQKQGLVFAMAILTSPSLLLADESTANLDFENSQKFATLLKELKTGFLAQDFAAVIVTHDLGIAIQFADRIAVAKRVGDSHVIEFLENKPGLTLAELQERMRPDH